MVDILMCKSDQLSICLCAVVVNGGYAHVQWWSMEGYAHVVAVNCQSSIRSCALVVNSGYIHVQE